MRNGLETLVFAIKEIYGFKYPDGHFERPGRAWWLIGAGSSCGSNQSNCLSAPWGANMKNTMWSSQMPCFPVYTTRTMVHATLTVQ